MRKDGYTYAVEKNEEGNGYKINIEIGQDIAKDSNKLQIMFRKCEKRIEQLTYEEELNMNKVKEVNFQDINFDAIKAKMNEINFYSDKFKVDTFKNKILLNIKAIYNEFNKYGVYKEDK